MSKVLLGLGIFSVGWMAEVSAGESGSRVIARVCGQEITAEEQPQMAGMITRGLKDRFCQEHGLEATPEELGEFERALERGEARTQADLEKRRASLAEELKGTGLTEEKRKSAEQQLKLTEDVLQKMAAMREQMKGQEEEVARARRRIGREMIRNWKFYRALYEKYGGRVIYQQLGPEPLDAMRDFLKEAEEKGTLVILDEGAKEEFWRYFVADGMHTFAPAAEAGKMMNTPWWRMER